MPNFTTADILARLQTPMGLLPSASDPTRRPVPTGMVKTPRTPSNPSDDDVRRNRRDETARRSEYTPDSVMKSQEQMAQYFQNLPNAQVVGGGGLASAAGWAGNIGKGFLSTYLPRQAEEKAKENQRIEQGAWRSALDAGTPEESARALAAGNSAQQAKAFDVLNASRAKSEDIREYEYAKKDGFTGGLQDWMKIKKGGLDQFGKQGAVFDDGKGNFYSIQFGSDGSRKIEPVATGGSGLQPSKGVFQVGDELINKSTGSTVRGVAPQIAGKEAAEEAGKAQGKAATDFPRVLDNADQALKTIEQIRIHPGRDWATGMLGSSMIPAVPGTPQRDFINLVDQAKGKAFLEAFNSLRGGGAITEVEGTKATQAIARLDRAQSKEGFEQALKDLEDVVKTGVGRVRTMSQGNFRQPQASGVPGDAASAPPAALPQVPRRRYNPLTGGLE